MGQKVNPIGLRLGINRTWDSRWFANDRDYGNLLHEDLQISKFINKRLSQAGVSKVIIERPAKKARITSILHVRVWSSAKSVRTSSVCGSRLPR